MKNPLSFIAAAFFAIAFPIEAHESMECKERSNPQKKAICFKQHFDIYKNNKEFIKSTREELRVGDENYMKKRFYEAYRAYDLSNMFLPSPYAFLRGSEAVFIDYATASHFEDDAKKIPTTCMPTADFVDFTDHTLFNYKVGVELAKIHHYGPSVTPAYLADSEKRISCLEGMATQYRNEKTGCVDVGKLQACMGVKK